MLPLRDNVRPRKSPVVTWVIIGVCALVFIYEISLSPANLQRFMANFGLVPARLHIFMPAVLLDHPSELLRLISAIFIHNGWVHFFSNMLILFAVGASVETQMDHWRYVIFFLAGGVAANLIQALFFPLSTVPVIGASGAIASVLGAYLYFFPAAHILTLVPIFLIPWVVEVPAFFYLGIWFLTQLYSGLLSLRLPEGVSASGVAWWAHVGGFLAGLFFARFYMLHHKPTASLWYPEATHHD